jgi:hypothetical protein
MTLYEHDLRNLIQVNDVHINDIIDQIWDDLIDFYDNFPYLLDENKHMNERYYMLEVMLLLYVELDVEVN